MILNIIGFLMEIWFSVFSRIVSMILVPAFNLLDDLGILNENYLVYIDSLVDQVAAKIVFARDVVCYATGIPAQVFYMISAYCMLMLSAYVSFLVIRFILNAYVLFRTGKSIGGSMK